MIQNLLNEGDHSVEIIAGGCCLFFLVREDLSMFLLLEVQVLILRLYQSLKEMF